MMSITDKAPYRECVLTRKRRIQFFHLMVEVRRALSA